VSAAAATTEAGKAREAAAVAAAAAAKSAGVTTETKELEDPCDVDAMSLDALVDASKRFPAWAWPYGTFIVFSCVFLFSHFASFIVTHLRTTQSNSHFSALSRISVRLSEGNFHNRHPLRLLNRHGGACGATQGGDSRRCRRHSCRAGKLRLLLVFVVFMLSALRFDDERAREAIQSADTHRCRRHSCSTGKLHVRVYVRVCHCFEFVMFVFIAHTLIILFSFQQAAIIATMAFNFGPVHALTVWAAFCISTAAVFITFSQVSHIPDMVAKWRPTVPEVRCVHVMLLYIPWSTH
jgi:hypothetical protein